MHAAPFRLFIERMADTIRLGVAPLSWLSEPCKGGRTERMGEALRNQSEDVQSPLRNRYSSLRPCYIVALLATIWRPLNCEAAGHVAAVYRIFQLRPEPKLNGA